jgi:hypothetical protein
VYSPDEGQEYSFDDRREAEARLRTELANGKLSFFLRGKGRARSRGATSTSDWLLIKHKDRFAQPMTCWRTRSVAWPHLDDRQSGNDTTDRRQALTASGPPRRCEDHSPDAAGSACLIDLSGRTGGSTATASLPSSRTAVRLQSRHGIDLTPAFPESRRLAARLSIG